MGVLNGVGTDFLAFWSAGKVASEYGYSQIYNLDLLKQIQYDALGYSNLPWVSFRPIPAPYFSIFILPFHLFSYMNPRTGFWIWTLINIIVLIGYLSFFTRKVNDNYALTKPQLILLVSLLISYPVYASFKEGQVEVLQLIFCGEFIRQALNKNHYLSGAWLAGMLIKPQILLLIIPALLLMKHWKVIFGFILSSLGILFISLMLSGFDGLFSMVKLWFAYVPGIASNSPDKMVNWRMIAVNLNNWTNSNLGWILAGIGMLITLIIWFQLSRNRPEFGSILWVKMYLAIFAVSCAFTWHSHIHMGMVLLPFLIAILLKDGSKQWKRIIDLWFLSYPIVLSITYFYIILFSMGVLKVEKNIDGFIFGITGLCIYMCIAFSVLNGIKKTSGMITPLNSEPPMLKNNISEFTRNRDN